MFTSSFSHIYIPDKTVFGVLRDGGLQTQDDQGVYNISSKGVLWKVQRHFISKARGGALSFPGFNGESLLVLTCAKMSLKVFFFFSAAFSGQRREGEEICVFFFPTSSFLFGVVFFSAVVVYCCVVLEM